MSYNPGLASCLRFFFEEQLIIKEKSNFETIIYLNSRAVRLAADRYTQGKALNQINNL